VGGIDEVDPEEAVDLEVDQAGGQHARAEGHVGDGIALGDADDPAVGDLDPPRRQQPAACDHTGSGDADHAPSGH
jgi:hypothetical protein